MKKLLVMFNPAVKSLTFNLRLKLSSVGLKNKSFFLVWKGGLGVLPRKILKTMKAGEAISGHFVGAILPSESEEFKSMLLPFILYALFK